MTSVLLRRDYNTDTHRKMAMRRQRLEKCCHNQGMPEATKSWKRQGTASPRALRGSTILPAPQLQTSSPQNWERINFCCLKSSSLCYFLLGALGNVAILLQEGHDTSSCGEKSTCCSPVGRSSGEYLQEIKNIKIFRKTEKYVQLASVTFLAVKHPFLLSKNL